MTALSAHARAVVVTTFSSSSVALAGQRDCRHAGSRGEGMRGGEVCRKRHIEANAPSLAKGVLPGLCNWRAHESLRIFGGAGTDPLTWGSSRSFASMLRSLFCSRLCAPMHVLMRHRPDVLKARFETAPAGLLRAVSMLKRVVLAMYNRATGERCRVGQGERSCRRAVRSS
jgi:hypothetical protein